MPFFTLLLSNINLVLKNYLLFILLTATQSFWAQDLYLKISGHTDKETQTIDLIGYTKKHPNVKSINDTNKDLSEKLTRKGYLENEILETQKTSDSTFETHFSLGQKTDSIHIYIRSKKSLQNLVDFNTKKDSIKISLSDTENYLNGILNQLEQKGYAFAKAQLIDFKKNKNNLEAGLLINLNQPRKINDIVIIGFDKFPESHRKNILRLYKNKTFNQETLKKINASFNQFRFASQTKYPEVLFTQDTTKAYVYLQKNKANKFDGLIGFANSEKNKLIFNGYADLSLTNSINAGETFSIFWKSNGEQQTTFNANLEIPYLFKTRLGAKANLNIFKQDSTFQNTKKNLDLGYLLNYNTRIYIGVQSTESSDIQNKNNQSIGDYQNNFYTLLFEYSKRAAENLMFPEKTNINFRSGLGQRNTNSFNNHQSLFEINLKQDFYFDRKNSISLKSQNMILMSSQYIINELYRFGGVNSVRGFNENSLQGNAFFSIITEYRNQLSPSLYLHSILDYGYYQDKTSNRQSPLLGIGLGMGLLTKNGLLNIMYANGTQNNQSVNPSNSIVHLKFTSVF